jgi:hypothetical protein
MSEEAISRFRSGLIAAVIALMVIGGYAMYEHGQANRMAAQNSQVAKALQDTQNQLETLKGMVNALNAQRAQAEAEAAARNAAMQHRVAARNGRPQVRRDDPRWKQFQSKLDAQNARLDEQGQAIESTRQDLYSAKSELSGSIARTHDEVVLLQKKGERNYYEFDLNKAKQFRAAGPVGVKLRKANTKHQFADLELMVDDVDLQKKHVNLYEPVVFYAADSGVPIELVINKITKDHIHGYVSEPKYKRSQLTAMANGNSNSDAAAENTTTTASSGPAPRQRLSLPKN